MEPYCYVYSEWEDVEIFPTVEKLVEFLKVKFASPYYLEDAGSIMGHYADGKLGNVDLSKFIEHLEITQELKDKAAACYAELKVANAKWEKGHSGITITGCSGTPSEEAFIKNYLMVESVQWK